ncbi:primary replicative DNA helicase [Desulfonauticus submarinus]|uniref:Replicative DNA helicase n=1 Tax=Desulfonauticus submarinus TaxID=206665 RepID=A0A1G9ZGS4_9BACT|nr:replicative DNA helicase [Desulfonauticus submarinus]SDN20444.1 primary replicative DNA helicase [Desulfonauticus submarinus]
MEVSKPKKRVQKSKQRGKDIPPSQILGKTPPHSLEAEKAVLGGVFLSNNIFFSLVDLLVPEDFYYPAHQIIFSVFIELYRRSIPIDLVTVAEELEKKGKLEDIGGAVYLASLPESVAASANALFYAQIVKEKSLRRRLIETGTELISKGFEEEKDIDEIVDESEQKIFSLAESSIQPVFVSTKELSDRVFEQLQKRVERKELVTGVPTGYFQLDEMTAGFQPTDLIIIAGRPSMGKTAFALNVAMRAAVQAGVPVAIFSLEMSKEQLMMRMLCSWGKVDLRNMRTGFLSDEDFVRLTDAASALSSAPIFIDDTPALSTIEVRARSRRLKSEHGLGMVIVDYLQLMRASRGIDSREQEISEISRSLKALAKELEVPVVALSQLNRKVEERTDKRPKLSDLRESGAIEQDADLILFLYRDEVYNKKEDNPNRGKAEVIIGKQRNGPIGKVELAYLGKFTAFENLAAEPTPSEG